MRFLRSFVGAGLALLLVFTSVSLAAARGQPLPAGQIVICTGMGLQTVAVDAQGKPVGAAHVCPDGLAAIVALGLAPPVLPERALGAGEPLAPLWADLRPGLAPPRARSRGPPGRVS
ncbi:MAG: hypothetical protein JXJ18_03570 [Rhodobacteraceae bacterium]|nr:hypothetical protein [Paracoccaceae bacterium]